MNNIIGINEEGLDKVVLDFYNYIEIINKKFIEISDIVEKLNNDFQSDCGTELLRKMNNSITLFEEVNTKLTNYADELSNVKMKYQDVSSNIANDTIKHSNDLSSDIK